MEYSGNEMVVPPVSRRTPEMRKRTQEDELYRNVRETETTDRGSSVVKGSSVQAQTKRHEIRVTIHVTDRVLTIGQL